MVRIIDGDIVQDNDPRLSHPGPPNQTHRAPPQHPSSSPGQAAIRPAGPHTGPLVRIIPPQPGQPGPLSAIPSLEVYGIEFPAVFLLAVGGAALMFGWRALIGLSVVWVVYQLNKQPLAQQQQQQHRGSPAATGPGGEQLTEEQQEFYRKFVAQGPPAGGRGPAPAPASVQSGQGSSAGAFQGRAYKLSG